MRADDVLFGMADYDNGSTGEFEAMEQGENAWEKRRDQGGGVFSPDLVTDFFFFRAQAKSFGEEGPEPWVIVDPEPLLQGDGLVAAVETAHLFQVCYMMNDRGAVDGSVVMVYQKTLVFHRLEP
jgi:hypothetical protein